MESTASSRTVHQVGGRLSSREAGMTLSQWTQLNTEIWLVIFATFHADLAIMPGSTTFRGLPKICKVTIIMQGQSTVDDLLISIPHEQSVVWTCLRSAKLPQACTTLATSAVPDDHTRASAQLQRQSREMLTPESCPNALDAQVLPILRIAYARCVSCLIVSIKRSAKSKFCGPGSGLIVESSHAALKLAKYGSLRHTRGTKLSACLRMGSLRQTNTSSRFSRCTASCVGHAASRWPQSSLVRHSTCLFNSTEFRRILESSKSLHNSLLGSASASSNVPCVAFHDASDVRCSFLLNMPL